MEQKSEIIFYQTEDAATRLQVRLDGETVWLSLNQMADLFQRDKSVISKHIRNVFEEGELQEGATVAKYATVQTEGGRQVAREIEHFNLDVIISVGYRVKSHRGTQFRIWATHRLREFIVKGFTMDDERLKQGGNYFDELLSRIREIRSSEKVFWKKVLEIYATSADYDPNVDTSRRFFATVQNKMHWAAHGHTAAEVIAERADARQANMGLLSFPGSRPKKADIAVAKNYLTRPEIEALNLIVSLYLDFAELQALSRKVMYMADWISKLDDFLRISDREILTHAGRISHESAVAKAGAEYDKYRALHAGDPGPGEKGFDEAVKKVKQLQAEKPRTDRKKPKPE